MDEIKRINIFWFAAPIGTTAISIIGLTSDLQTFFNLQEPFLTYVKFGLVTLLVFSIIYFLYKAYISLIIVIFRKVQIIKNIQVLVDNFIIHQDGNPIELPINIGSLRLQKQNILARKISLKINKINPIEEGRIELILNNGRNNCLYDGMLLALYSRRMTNPIIEQIRVTSVGLLQTEIYALLLHKETRILIPSLICPEEIKNCQNPNQYEVRIIEDINTPRIFDLFAEILAEIDPDY